MSSPISLNTAATPKGLYDTSRPAPMTDADKIFNRLMLKYGNDSFAALELLSEIESILTSTKHHEVDEAWEKFEKLVNNGNAIKVDASTGIGQYNTLYSMFYSGLEVVDANPSNAALTGFRDLFFETANYVDGKIQGHFSTEREGRVLSRILTTIDNRVVKVTDHFNSRVEKGEIDGPQVFT